MMFGSEEVFRYLVENVANADSGNFDFYDRIYQIADEDGNRILRKSFRDLQECDRQDIMSEVHIKLLKKLVTFIRDTDSQTVAARESWFIKTVTNTARDWLKKYNKPIVSTEVDLGDKTPADRSAEAEQLNAERKKLAGEIFERIVREVCASKSLPVNKICFFYNIFSQATKDDEKAGNRDKKEQKRSRLEQVCDLLNGKTLDETLFLLKCMLRAKLFGRLPEDVFRDLEEKLDGPGTDTERIGDSIFNKTPKEITKATNEVKERLVRKMLTTEIFNTWMDYLYEE